MQVRVLQNSSHKCGGYQKGQVLDLPEETVRAMPGFFQAFGDSLAIEAAQKRAHLAQVAVAHEDRIARKVSMARLEADRQAAQADLLMKDATARLELAEQAKRQAALAAEHAEQLAAAAPAPAELPSPSAVPAPALPPHKRNRAQ